MTTHANEIEIHKLLETKTNAIRRKDAAGALKPYAAEVIRYDLAPPLANAGPQALSKDRIEGWFATWDGPIGFELRTTSTLVSGDLAFCCGFVRISGTKTNGEWNDVWPARRHACAEWTALGRSCTSTSRFRSTWTAP